MRNMHLLFAAAAVASSGSVDFGRPVPHRPANTPDEVAVAARSDGTHADFIIAGSGAGGGPLAARLADAGFTVLLLESGKYLPDDKYIETPAFYPATSDNPEISAGYFVELAKEASKNGWNYQANKHTNDDYPNAVPRAVIPAIGRTMPALPEDKVWYPRGMTVGGSTSTSATVNMGVSDADWTRLGQVTGDSTTWDAASMKEIWTTKVLSDHSTGGPMLAALHAMDADMPGCTFDDIKPWLESFDAQVDSLILSAVGAAAPQPELTQQLLRNIIPLPTELQTARYSQRAAEGSYLPSQVLGEDLRWNVVSGFLEALGYGSSLREAAAAATGPIAKVLSTDVLTPAAPIGCDTAANKPTTLSPLAIAYFRNKVITQTLGSGTTGISPPIPIGADYYQTQLEALMQAPNVAADPSGTSPLGIHSGGDAQAGGVDPGLVVVPMSLNKGRRSSVRERIAFSRENNVNFMLLDEALVSKVIIEDYGTCGKRATGVKVLHGAYLNDASGTVGNSHFDNNAASAAAATPSVYKARYEVILSGGTFESPKILQLSGIGPKAVVEALGVTSVVDAPGVGKNLRDRIEMPWTVRYPPYSGGWYDNLATWPCANPYVIAHPPVSAAASVTDVCYDSYVANEKANTGSGNPPASGPYAAAGHSFATLTKSSLPPYGTNGPNDIVILPFPGMFDGYKPYSILWPALTQYDGYMSLNGLLTHTKSTGTVTASDSRPYVAPKIDFQQFSDTEGPLGTSSDMHRAKDMYRQIQAISDYTRDHYTGHGFTPADMTHVVPPPQTIAEIATSDAALEDWISSATWGHHACCTNKMGPDSDANAVLDSKMRVRGVGRLRVVDASIFPEIPGAYMVQPVVLASEKAAELLIAEYSSPAADPTGCAATAPCVGKSLAVTVTGQPSIAVGFVQITSAGDLPMRIANLVDQTTGALVGEYQLQCSATGDLATVLTAHSAGSDLSGLSGFTFASGSEFAWKASSLPGISVYLQIPTLVDIQYAYAPFSIEDSFHGQMHMYEASSDGFAFLAGKFSWTPGVSTTTSLVSTVKAMKKASGGCPMMRRGYNRNDDLGGDRLLIDAEKRQDYAYQNVAELQGGVPDSASEDWRRLASLMTMQERDDEIFMRRTFFLDAPLKFDQRVCLADRFAVERHQVGGDLRRHEGNTYEYAAAVTSTDYLTGDMEGRLHLGFGSTSGMSPRSQLSFPTLNGPTEHLAFKNLLNRLFPPNNGFGKTADGLTVPDLSTKWTQMRLPWPGLNITHVPEMVHGLVHEWTSGAPVASLTELFSAYLENCMTNTFYNREASMFRNLVVGMPGNCKNERQLLDGLATHYYQSPVWDIVRDEKAKVDGKYDDLWTPRNLAAVIFANSAFLSDNIEMAARYFLEHADARAKYLADPETALIEYLRLSAPIFTSYTMADTHDVTAKYTRREFVDGEYKLENKTEHIKLGKGHIERINLYAANRDPSAFSAPNEFKPERNEWHRALTFGAPLDIWYDVDPATGARTFNSKKPVDDPSVKSRFYCPAFYMLKEVGKKVISAILASQTQVYAYNREPGQCREDSWEIGRVFGYQIYPEYSYCRNAIARMDARYERGVGCEVWGQYCCATCNTVNSLEHTHATRLMLLRTMWFADQFSFIDTATYRYQMATQKHWDKDSIVEVTPTGKKNYYKGPENILEYYSLQNVYFNPPSYRVSVSTYNMTMRYWPKYDRVLDDNKRIHSWNFDPAVTGGTEPSGYVDAPYDFSQFVWPDTTSIVPISRAYHDFRSVNAKWHRSGKPPQMAAMFKDVEQLCHIIMERCIGNYSQFPNFEDCYDYMSKRPKYKLGYCPLLAGDTLACRWTHVILSHEKMRPDVHCYHMGPNLPDPNGKIKCSDEECGADRAGQIECNSQTCDGQYMHAGKVVDKMHFVYWFLVWLLAGYYTFHLHRERTVLLKAIKSIGSNHQLRKDAEASINLINRSFPIGIGWFAVSTFFWTVFLALSELQSDAPVFWRPWPIQAIFPRFSEVHSGSSHYKTKMRLTEFGGENTEGLISSFNQYIVDHLVFYILLTATFLFIFILEWLGTYMHMSHLVGGQAESNERTGNLAKVLRFLPELGHAAFVVFVTISLYFPTSAFGYLLFCFGITKLMYPEITIHLWSGFYKELPKPKQKKPKKVANLMNSDGIAKLAAQAMSEKKLQQRLNNVKFGPTGARLKNLAENLASADSIQKGLRRTATGLKSTVHDKIRNTDSRHSMEIRATNEARAKALVTQLDEAQATNQGIVLDSFVQPTVHAWCNLIAGIGLLLHHSSLAMIYCASSLHLHEELVHPYSIEKGIQALRARAFGLGIILVFVLVQHLVAQVVPGAFIRSLVLAVVEIFFQWFTISNLTEVATTLDCVGILGLMVSHYLMAVAIVDALVSTFKKEKEDEEFEDDDDSEPELSEKMEIAVNRWAARGVVRFRNKGMASSCSIDIANKA